MEPLSLVNRKMDGVEQIMVQACAYASVPSAFLLIREYSAFYSQKRFLGLDIGLLQTFLILTHRFSTATVSVDIA
jgi:hypothetical protein